MPDTPPPTYDDLFLSILSMDSYSRNNNQGVFMPSAPDDDSSGIVIGNAEIIGSTVDAEHSFYAIAYRLSDGTIVVDYRGTDDLNFSNPTVAAANDLFNGWLVGGGVTINNQSGLALEFYQNILNLTGHYDLTPFDPAPSNFVFTGHSLGGGLAGMVAALSHGKALVTDPMPYPVVALVEYVSEVINLMSVTAVAAATFGVTGQDATDALIALALISPTAAQIYVGLALNELESDGALPQLPNWSSVKGYHVEGEILQFLRDGTLTGLGAEALSLVSGIFGSLAPTGSLATLLSLVTGGLAGISEAYTAAFSTSNLTVNDTELSTFGWTDAHGGPNVLIDHHSAALDVLLTYSSFMEGQISPSFGDWHQDTRSVNAVLNALYNDSVGAALGLKQQAKNPVDGTTPVASPGSYTGFVNPADQMTRMIAYSAIMTGTTVFGNTAVQALFDDADDLEHALSGTSSLNLGAKGLGEILAQFSGGLAYHKIEVDDHAETTLGVLDFNTTTRVLTVDLSDSTWTVDGEVPLAVIVGRDDFVSDYVNGSGVSSILNLATMGWVWDTISLSLIDRFVLHTDNADTTFYAPGSETDSDHVTLELFGDGDDILIGSDGNDFIIGGAGNDAILGSQGNNVLVGAEGDDTITGGDGKDLIVGGAGIDTVDYTHGQPTPEDTSLGGFHIVVTADVIDVDQNGTDNSDHLYGIENIELGDRDDAVEIHTLNPNLTGTVIDGGDQSDAAGDQISFEKINDGSSGPSLGIYFGPGEQVDYAVNGKRQSGTGGIHFTNFESVVGSHGNDVYDDGNTQSLKVDLGDGADTVLHAGAGTLIDLGTAGHDVDIVNVNAGVGIQNFGAEDQLWYNGQRLYGALQNMSSELMPTSNGGMIKWGLSPDGELVVMVEGLTSPSLHGGELNGMYIEGWKDSYGHVPGATEYTGNGDITLAKFKITAVRVADLKPGQADIMKTWELFGLETKVMTGHDFWGGKDPLVLDLDGDGFDLNMLSTTAPQFDIDADLYKEYAGWVGRDDGMLVRDIGADGKIEDSRELFGGTSDGFTILATLDGNHDGVVNADDDGLADFNGDGTVDSSDTFSDLQIWVDGNQNGVSDSGELKALSDYDVVGLNVTSTPSTDSVGGNLITATSTFIRGDGSTGALGEAVLAVDNSRSTYIGPDITITTEAAAEPDLKGFGTLVSLRQALSVEPDDLSLVDLTMSSFDLADHDMATLRADIRPLLTAWADGSPLRDAAGDIVHGAAANPDYSDIPIIRDNGDLGDYAWNIEASTTTEGEETANVLTLKFVSGLEVTLTTAEGQAQDLSGLWTLEGDPVSSSVSTSVVDGVTLYTRTYVYADGQVLTGTGAASSSATLATLAYGSFDQTIDYTTHHFTSGVILGGDLAFFERYLGEVLPFHEQPDDASAALPVVDTAIDAMEETLNLLAARVAVQSDAFAPIFGDIAYDVDSNTFHGASGHQLMPTFANLLTLADSQSDPLTWLKSWDPLLSTIIADYDRGDGGINTNGFLAQNIVGAFESVHPSFDVLTAVEGLGLDPDIFVTGEGDLTGTDDADIFYLGGGSDQTATGGKGLDNYIIGADFGHSTINDIEPALEDHYDDVVRFTTLNPDDVTLTRDGIDLTITDNATGDTLTIEGQFYGEWAGPLGSGYWPDEGIAALVFADGTVWDDIDMARAASHPDADSTTVTGTADNDFMDGGTGDDLLEGAGDGDIYVFGPGYGNDTIHDVEDNPFREAFDILTFRTGISPDDLTFHRDGDSDDLLITIDGDTSDTITILGQFAATYTGVFGTIFSNQIEVLTFEDGGTLSADEIDQKIIESNETSGNDTIYGFAREDVLEGGRGNDFLSGGNENDTYIFNRGDGDDTVADAMDNILGGRTDTLQFGAGIAASDVTFTRDGDDLVATINDDGGSVRIQGQYAFFESGVFGTLNFNLVENFVFADGTTMGWREIMDGIIQASETSGDDHILGTHFNDVFDAGEGDDLIEGDSGADTYRFGIGDGHDTISDNAGNILAEDGDTIAFKTGVTLADIHIERTGDSLQNALITVGDDGDSLLIEGQFSYTTINVRSYEIENFTFADGTTLTTDDLRELYIAQHETTGDDTVDGFYTDDTLNGGAGDDVLRGGDGSDTYVFDAGFGHDTIEESVTYVTYDDNDVIQFGAGLLSTDAILTRDGDDLVIAFTGASDQVTITGQFSHFAYFDGWSDIESVSFADGVTWTADDIRTQLIAQSETSGDDTVIGFYGADVIDGGAGNDTLEGLGGGDTYLFGIGSGQDTIIESIASVYEDDPDTLSFKAGVTADDVGFLKSGNDLLISIAGSTDSLRIQDQFLANSEVESFVFSDGTVLTATDVAALAVASQGTSGNDTITGTSHADLIDGGAGNDLLEGGDGPDTYRFEAGFGQDTIQETVAHFGTSDDDAIVFAAGLDAADLVLSRSGNDLILGFTGTTDTITVTDQFFHFGSFPGFSDIEHIYFADGTSLSDNDIRLDLIAQSETSGNDTIYGYYTDDVFDGGAGNDTIYGYGGGDTYNFGRGDGSDTIYESIASVYEDLPDTLAFKSGVSPLDVTFSKSGSDLIAKINGTSDQVTVAGFFTTYQYQIENFTFADGTTYDVTEVTALANRAPATSGNDTLVGTVVADVMQGLAGNDSLTGLAGSDLYVYNLGDGADTIYEGAAASDTDTLSYGAGVTTSNLLIARSGLTGAVLTVSGQTGSITLDNQFKAGGYGIEQIQFDGGTTWSLADIRSAYLSQAETTGNDTVYGFDGVNDSLQGGHGTDSLYGGTGSDTYTYNSGDGTDTLYEGANAGDTDKLVLGTGLNPSGLTFTRSGNSLVLHFTAQSAVITLDNQINPAAGYGFEQVQFGDGTLWSASDLVYAYALSGSTTGNDSISGVASQNDFLAGGLGNDTLSGNSGSDTYYYNLGDGADTIAESPYSGDTDTLVLGSGLTTSNTVITRSGETGAVVTFTGHTGSVTLNTQFYGSGFGIEQIRFSDGTVWSTADMQANYLAYAQTSGNDTVYGFDNTNDTLQGGLGNDTLNGFTGSDTYIYNIGDGADTIVENPYSGDTDVISFGSGITTSNLVVAHTSQYNMSLSISGQSGSIAVGNEFYGSGYGVEQIHFSDGTTWTVSDLRTAYLSHAGTSGNDTILGFDGSADSLQGGAGNDSLYGYTGSDTYIYNLGDGADTIYEGPYSGDTDVLSLGSGITTSNIQVTHYGTYGISLTFAGQSGSILLDSQLFGSGYGIEQIHFNDGTTWNAAQILANAWLRGNQFNDTITGTSGADKIDGDGGNDTLSGGDGNDYLWGNTGNDTLTGGNGSDTFGFGTGFGKDTITDFSHSQSDVIEFSTALFADFTAVQAASTQVGANVVITFDTNDTVTLNGITLAALQSSDFHFV